MKFFAKRIVAMLGAITLGSVLWLPSRAAAEEAKEQVSHVLDRLQQHYRETRSFSAKFTEEISPVGASKRNRTGSVYFCKPGKMRWEFDEPNRELIVSDGDQVFDYDPDLNQVVGAPLSQALRSPGATEFLLGVGDIAKDFHASVVDDGAADGLIHLKLVPKIPGNTVKLGLDPKNYDSQTIQVTDQLGNVTTVKFSAIQDNTSVSDSMFHFVPPQGADIVHPASVK